MSENIKGKAFSGAIWKLLERVIAQGISLVVSIVIARILDPEDYSVVSIVAIFFTFANVFITSGFNTALIQKKDADSDDYSSVLITSMVVSVALYFIMFFAAPIIAKAYRHDILVQVIRVMGLALPITAFKSILCAYISSKLLFRKFFFATIGGTIISAFVGIWMAIKGFGPWALVAQQLTNTIIDTLILWITTRVRFGKRFSVERMKPLFQYSWKLFVAQMIGTAYVEINPLIIGMKYSGKDLSFYTKGRSFPHFMSTSLTSTLSSVLFPVLSKYQDSKEHLLKYTRLFIMVTSYIVFPLMIGLLVVSDSFVSLVLTDKWLPASIYIKIFCIANMFDMINSGNCETIKAMGRSDIYLKIDIIKKTAYFAIIGLFLLLSNSPEMLAVSFIICALVAITVNSFPNRKLIGYHIKDQVMDVLPNLINSTIMGVTVYFIGRFIPNKLVCLIIQILSGIIIYLFIGMLTHNKGQRYMLETAQDYINKR